MWWKGVDPVGEGYQAARGREKTKPKEEDITPREKGDKVEGEKPNKKKDQKGYIGNG